MMSRGSSLKMIPLNEDELMKLVDAEGYDMVIGDPPYQESLPGGRVRYNLPRFMTHSLYSSSSDEGHWLESWR